MTSTAAPDISVLMVTFNGWHLAERAILSLLPQDGPGCRVEIVLVDNASSDGTEAKIAERYPSVRYLRLDRNYGFAVANNRGLTICRAPLVFMLNNDTIADADALRALMDAATKHPSFDLFAPQMIRLREPTLVDNRGIYVDRTGHFRQIHTGMPVAGGPGKCEVFGPSGGAAVARRSLLDRVGLFDEALHSYLEDADFAARSRSAGARCLYVADARILHEGSATARQMPDRKLYLIQRNMRVLRRRWLASPLWSSTRWWALAYEWFQVAKAAYTGQAVAMRHAIVDARGLRSEAERWATSTARRRVAAWIGVRMRAVRPF